MTKKKAKVKKIKAWAAVIGNTIPRHSGYFPNSGSDFLWVSCDKSKLKKHLHNQCDIAEVTISWRSK